VLGWPEDSPLRKVEHALGNLVPFARLVLVDNGGKHAVLFLRPGDPLFIQDEIQILKLQKLCLLIEKNLRKLIPQGLRLHKRDNYDGLFVDVSKIGITYNKPDKEASLVLVPAILINRQLGSDLVSK
jgi:hypothetical protein